MDRKAQPHYPFPFIQLDVRDFLADRLKMGVMGFGDRELIHASPPCQPYSALKAFASPDHEELVPETRRLLDATGAPYIMENVPGAPMRYFVELCGSMFDLKVRRHRLFESNLKLTQPQCLHQRQRMLYPEIVGVYGRGASTKEDWAGSMGIDWMNRNEMAQAIPPAYTEFLGRQVFEMFR